ncbi:hypothetical protein [Mesorhizobium sp. M0933]|uniref:hypothetical protein n=1 Tax=unclassified Mesorhizobium TaxID=325217 RepID=UPI003338AA04
MATPLFILVEDRPFFLLTSKPAFSHDPAVCSSQGIDISKLEFVVVTGKACFGTKSHAFEPNMPSSLGRSGRRHWPGGLTRTTLSPKRSSLLSITEADGAIPRTDSLFHQRQPAQGR